VEKSEQQRHKLRSRGAFGTDPDPSPDKLRENENEIINKFLKKSFYKNNAVDIFPSSKPSNLFN
jgi:hypothetical protein